MRITLVGYGTRGDVQPFLSLAWVLRERGHEVKVVAPKNMREWITGSGISFAPLPVDVHALFTSGPGQRMLAAGNISAFFKWLAVVEQEYLLPMRRALVDECAGAEMLVGHTLMDDRLSAIAEARRIPVVPMYFFPILPSSRFASPFLTTRNFGPLNRLTHRLFLDMIWRSSRDDANALRAELGLEPARVSYTREAQRLQLPCILAYSEALVPRPPDYAPNNFVTGSIGMPLALREKLGEAGLPEKLETFLRRGSPPVYIGFGSMPIRDTDAMRAAIDGALREVDARAVLVAGWSEPSTDADDRVFSTTAVDHDALLPQCAAAVHHGGSGTTHASLRAGVPTVVCSLFADQPFWGKRVTSLGAGATFPLPKLNQERLVRALRQVLAHETRLRAQGVADKLSADDGLSAAITVLENVAPRAPYPWTKNSALARTVPAAPTAKRSDGDRSGSLTN